VAGVILDGRLRYLEREHNGRAWLAYHVAALQRAQKLPRLESLLYRKREPRRQQSSADFWDIMRAHVIAAGGKVITDG